MVEQLLDSSVMIEHLRGRSVLAERGITTATARRHGLHPVCSAELIEGARDRRSLVQLGRFMREFTPVECTHADLLDGLDLLAKHRLAHGVDWHDCVIAATARRMGVPVLTINVKHFRCFAGLKVRDAGRD